jgi:hypothetical protein
MICAQCKRLAWKVDGLHVLPSVISWIPRTPSLVEILERVGLLPLGELSETSQPGSQLANGTQLVPLWLGYATHSILTALNYMPERMEIANRDAYHGGQECIELDIPRKGRGWNGKLHVSRQAPYSPLCFRSTLKDVTTQLINIEYSQDAAQLYPVATFRNEIFDAKGRADRTIIGRVMSVVVNKPLPKATFELEFPVGTRVAHKKSDGQVTYFIQKSGGIRESIDQTKSSRFLPPEPPTGGK